MRRTTLILEEGCMDAVRELARREGRPISEIVNELLAEGLQRRRSKAAARFELPHFRMGVPRVDIADRDALEAAMEN